VVDDNPLLAPDSALRHEAWGLEDPRLTWVEDLDSWVIAYTSFGPGGPGLSLATTKDFRSALRLGMVRAPEDKNGALLSRRIGGEYVAPPSGRGPDHRADICVALLDLHSWAPWAMAASRRWRTRQNWHRPPPIETPRTGLIIRRADRLVRSTAPLVS
jgi:predicted GH43/DUF377 family glycosyl hydrolase